MSQSRSISRSVSGGTISIDASYAQELLQFWIQKYEQAKGELDQIKETSVSPSLPSRESSYDEGASVPSSTTENEEPELDALRACNGDLKNKLAASEEQRLALLRQIRPFLAQNATLAFEADVLRQQKINGIYRSAAFFPAGSDPLTFRFSSPQAVSDKLSAVSYKTVIPKNFTYVHKISIRCQDIPSALPRIRFVSRPPACLPLRVTACGHHGYWFSPTTVYPQDFEFELIVEGNVSEWAYLGKYKNVHLPGGEMRLSEWLALDDETKDVHCTRAATQRLGKNAITPATVSAAAAELRRQYESGQAAVPCFMLVCTGFTLQVYTALQTVATQTRKRKPSGQVGGKRIKTESK